MKTKFNYQLVKDELFNITIKNLEKKLYLLPEKDLKKEYYDNLLQLESSIIHQAKFDGYFLMLTDIINTAKSLKISINCFGAIQNSLFSYLLDISNEYKEVSIVDFILFEEEPTINIIASSYRYNEVIDYLQRKYNNLIDNIKKNTIYFKDNLKIVFYNLNVDTINKPKKSTLINLGLDYKLADINYSQTYTSITKNNEILLGLDDFGIGEVIASKIILQREEKQFIDFEDLVQRVPLIKNIGKFHLKRIEASFWQNLQNYLTMQELKDRCVYKIISRNARYGIWLKEKNGFLISRKKFNANYLFIEYHWDFDDIVGTVKPVKIIEKILFEIDTEYDRHDKNILDYLNNIESNHTTKQRS